MEFSTEADALLAIACEQGDLERLTAKQKEAIASLKHDHIVEGSMVRALDVGGAVAAKWKAKFICAIRTRGVDGEFDGSFRIVATSDLHQVHHTEAVKKALKKATSPGKVNSRIAALQALLAKHGIEETETETTTTPVEEIDLTA